MTLPELDEQIAKNEARLKQLRQDANQLADDIAAARAFRAAFPRLMGMTSEAPLERAAHIEQAPLFPRSDVKLAGLIREAIMRCGEDYTIYDVEKVLAEAGVKADRLKISQTLSDWARKGKINIKERGLGNAASTYTKRQMAA